MKLSPARAHAHTVLVLWGLTLLFALRIAAQPLALLVPALPDFSLWHGSLLPYPVLLAFQLGILALMVATNLRAGRSELPCRPRLARSLTLFGTAYFSLMLARVLIGHTLAAVPAWFNRPLPVLFHLVLATWLLLVAREFGSTHD